MNQISCIYRYGMMTLCIQLLGLSLTSHAALPQQPVSHADQKNVLLDGICLPLIKHENFEQGNDQWTATDATAWSIQKVADDNHAMGLNRRQSKYKPKHRSPLNIALLNDVQVTDFVLTFDVRSTKDTGNHRDCCVFFAHQNPTQFYYAHLGAKPDPASGQIMIVNNAPRTPMSKNKNHVGWDDDWHQVKLTRNASNGEIKVYFDDMQKPLMTATDKTFTKGQVGIGSFDDMNDFDNIRLYGRTFNPFCGCSSVVERQLPKLNVEGSIPFTRFFCCCQGFNRSSHRRWAIRAATQMTRKRNGRRPTGR